jgi:uncharacterized alpha-E superfamily protein
VLLGRTANGLYWMARYIERAENMSRLIDAGLRMALTRTQNAAEEWTSVVVSAGADTGFRAKHSDYTVAHGDRLPPARSEQSRPAWHRLMEAGAKQRPHGAHRADPGDLGSHQRSLDVVETDACVKPIDERDSQACSMLSSAKPH